MENIIRNLFFHQWQRKLVAFCAALLLWIFVNHTIISTKTLPSVPIKIINLPNDQTVIGLMPNGFLAKRMTLTLTGTKDVIEQLEPGDLEIVVDVSNQPPEGVLKITKKNLVSLNPTINLNNHINAIDYLEYILKMSPILTEDILIQITSPIGEAPEGYDFLDIWPLTLTQKITGPQDLVLSLKEKGLSLTFNLNDISKEELDLLKSNGIYDDVINFNIPDSWKKIQTTLPGHFVEVINDMEAKNLYISFLRKKPIYLGNKLPIHLFYPLKNSESINPLTYVLTNNQFVKRDNHIPILNVPLYVNNVSKLFLEVVANNLEIEIIAAPKSEREKLAWSIGFINTPYLEEIYVAYLLSHSKAKMKNFKDKEKEREKYLRQRFRNFIHHFSLFLAPEYPLEIESWIDDHLIWLHIPNASKFISQEENTYAE